MEKKNNEYIKHVIEDNIAVVTIDKPPVNALSSQCYRELDQLVIDLDKREDVRVIVITGAGEKAFAAGADINEFVDLDSASGAKYTAYNNSVRERIRNLKKPVVCAINGLALGGGCVLTLMCDIRVACHEVKMNLAEINMGIIGGTQYLSRSIPLGKAKYLVYTGNMISAEEAFQIGLVDVVVSRNELMPYTMKLAKKIASKPPLALKKAKECMNKSEDLTLEEGLKIEEEIVTFLWGTEDKKEGVQAFLEKRKPDFKGE